jgi:hypothetical protein
LVLTPTMCALQNYTACLTCEALLLHATPATSCASRPTTLIVDLFSLIENKGCAMGPVHTAATLLRNQHMPQGERPVRSSSNSS